MLMMLLKITQRESFLCQTAAIERQQVSGSLQSANEVGAELVSHHKFDDQDISLHIV